MPTGQNLQSFDADVFGQEVEEARQQSGTFQYGQLTLQARYLQFAGKGEPPKELTAGEYKRLKKSKDAQGLAMEMVMSVDGAAFNPNQRFVYTRKFRVGGYRSKNPDWYKTISPAIIDVLGDASNLKSGLWVEVEDVGQIDGEYNAPALRRTFADMNECARAWKERYTSRSQSANTTSPASASGIPGATISMAQKVFANVGNDETTFRAVAESDPVLSKYSIVDLLAAVKA